MIGDFEEGIDRKHYDKTKIWLDNINLFDVIGSQILQEVLHVNHRVRNLLTFVNSGICRTLLANNKFIF